jgi:hypothetical protein
MWRRVVFDIVGTYRVRQRWFSDVKGTLVNRGLIKCVLSNVNWKTRVCHVWATLQGSQSPKRHPSDIVYLDRCTYEVGSNASHHTDMAVDMTFLCPHSLFQIVSDCRTVKHCYFHIAPLKRNHKPRDRMKELADKCRYFGKVWKANALWTVDLR